MRNSYSSPSHNMQFLQRCGFVVWLLLFFCWGGGGSLLFWGFIWCVCVGGITGVVFFFFLNIQSKFKYPISFLSFLIFLLRLFHCLMLILAV